MPEVEKVRAQAFACARCGRRQPARSVLWKTPRPDRLAILRNRVTKKSGQKNSLHSWRSKSPGRLAGYGRHSPRDLRQQPSTRLAAGLDLTGDPNRIAGIDCANPATTSNSVS